MTKMVFGKKCSALLLLGTILLLIALVQAKIRPPKGVGGRNTPPQDSRNQCPVNKSCKTEKDCANCGRRNKCLPKRRTKRAGGFDPNKPSTSCAVARAAGGRGGGGAGGSGGDGDGNGNPPDVYDVEWWKKHDPPGVMSYKEEQRKINRTTDYLEKETKRLHSIWYKGESGPPVLKACLKGYCTRDDQCEQMALYRKIHKDSCGRCHFFKDEQTGALEGYGSCGHGKHSDRKFHPDSIFAAGSQYGPTDVKQAQCPNLYCRNNDDCKDGAAALKPNANLDCGQCWYPVSPRCGKMGRGAICG